MADDDALESIEDAIANAEEGVELGTVKIDPPQAAEKVDSDSDCSLDKIAQKLLKHNFILTALEFHAELVESGRELPRLRDYFSNPGNFEKNLQVDETSPVLPRTSSIQTFDSLDFARYSDDGDRQVDERVAVLEFELRKAKETIKALRANLTVATESEPNTPSSSVHPGTPEPMKPHEKRALNFLVNEYLLQNNYKLTSITFSDENDDQDFEDWDDVGLNIPKPPDVLHIYRNYCRSRQLKDVVDQTSQTFGTSAKDGVDQPLCDCKDIYDPIVSELKSKMEKLTQEKDEFLRVSEAKSELESMVRSLKRELNMLKNMDKVSTHSTSHDEENHVSNDVKDSPETRHENQDFVMVSSFSSYESVDSNRKEELGNLLKKEGDPSPSHEDSVPSPALSQPSCDITSSRKISTEFQSTILNLCLSQKITQNDRLVSEVTEVMSSKETVVTMLARCIPHIVPNILLAKREELLPLILSTIALHPDAKERDKLLNILFNLIKKPDQDQRHMILNGLVAIAQHLGSARVEAELLPQCWEQITHKYIERRLLVAESCGVLAPYVPSGIRSSLLLSMLQQMLQEDKEESVRETVVRNLALLFVYVDDSDKFPKAVELLHCSLEDQSSSVVEAGLNILLPSIAAWALEIGKIESQLFPTIIKVLEDQLKRLNQKLASNVALSPQDEQHPVLYIRALYCLVHFLLLSVLQTGPFLDNLEKVCNSPREFDVDRLPVCTSVLQDLAIVLGDSAHLASLIKAFDKYISAEWFKPWDKYDWVVNNFLAWVLQISSELNPQCQPIIHSFSETVNTFCHLFGRRFVQDTVKPPFMALFRISEDEKASGIVSSNSSLMKATLSVYIAGVLTAFFQEEDRLEMLEFFHEIFHLVSMYNIPVVSLRAAFVELSANKAYHELLLTVLWDGVVHTSASVRITAGRLFETLVGLVSESLLRTRVTPALVTLASDPEISVRIATVPAFGAIMEICSQKDLLEKVHLQFQTFLDDPVYWHQYLLHAEVIRTFAKLGPNAEPKFRDDFILPRLAALAAQNNHATDEARKSDIALALLDAYIAMSCCFMSDQLIAEAFLPGLRCLRQDLQTVAPEHEELVISMIQEFESKLDLNRSIERERTGSTISIPSPSSIEDMRNRMSKIFTSRAVGQKANIPNFFRRK